MLINVVVFFIAQAGLQILIPLLFEEKYKSGTWANLQATRKASTGYPTSV